MLKDYGVLVSATFSFLFLFVGWFVILNSTKYITSRNESKSSLNELNQLIDKTFESSVEFWSEYNDKTEEQRRAFIKRSLTIHSQLKRYRKLLKHYGLEVLPENELRRVKNLLTMLPSKDDKNSAKALNLFLEQKVTDSNALCNQLILDNSYAFMHLHTPVHSPALDRLKIRVPKLSAMASNVVFWIFITIVYFALFFYFLP